MSEAILYDPATDMPIYFNPAGDPPEAPIYNLEKTIQYLHIRIPDYYVDDLDNFSVTRFQFCGVGYSYGDGRIRTSSFSGYEHLSGVQVLDKFQVAPITNVSSPYPSIGPLNILVRLDLLKQFGYGLNGSNYEIVLRHAAIWKDDGEEPVTTINETVMTWIDDTPDYDADNAAGAETLAVVCPWLPASDYASPTIPGAEAQVATISVAVADDSITIY